MTTWPFVKVQPSFEAYRLVRLDDKVCLRLVGSDGRQHRLLSLALSALLKTAHDPRTASRYAAAFRDFLNVVAAEHPEPADAFIRSVRDCRRTADRYLVAMEVRTRDLGDGSRWLRPPPSAHRRVADALVAVGKITKFLTHAVFDGQDPSKVDHVLSRTSGSSRMSIGRNGSMRLDTDRRLRIGSDPTMAPRLDDPQIYDAWAAGLKKVKAREVFHRILAMLRHSGMRSFQALGLTLHDVFCKGARRTLPVPNKGDGNRERTLHKKLPPEEYEALLSYIDGERARVSGLSLKQIRLAARDPRRWSELEGVPLFTENGADHVSYDRLRKVTRAAAVAMDLVLGDEDEDGRGAASARRLRYVVLHMLRHQYVHARLAEIDGLHETRQGSAKRDLIRYMGWSGESMLRWYSEHYRIGRSGRITADHNVRLDHSIVHQTFEVAGEDFDAAMEELA